MKVLMCLTTVRSGKTQDEIDHDLWWELKLGGDSLFLKKQQ